MANKAIKDTAPEWLGTTAKRYWRKLAPQIDLGGSNADTLALLCDGLELYRLAKDNIDANGITVEGPYGPKANPCVAIQKQAFLQVCKSAQLLSIKPGEGDDPLSTFFGGK